MSYCSIGLCHGPGSQYEAAIARHFVYHKMSFLLLVRHSRYLATGHASSFSSGTSKVFTAKTCHSISPLFAKSDHITFDHLLV